ncbi:MAG: hypothetical protein LUC88_04560 [Prevotella sp.]|nr:hypothetical protein [Prevotella sp.]
MEYSKQTLAKIDELASDMMSPKEIAHLLGIDELSLCDDINTYGNAARRAFFHGATVTAHGLRKSVRELAEAGSPFSISECQRQIEAMLSEVTI